VFAVLEEASCFWTIRVEIVGAICPLKTLRWGDHLACDREIIALIIHSKNIMAGRKREIDIFWVHQKHFGVSSNGPHFKLV
jgi:hypothetical protein